MIRDLVVARYLRSSMVAKARMDIQEWSRNAAVAVLCRHAALLSAHYRLSERKLMSLGVESLHESVLCAPVQPQGGKAAGGEAEESPGKYHLSVGGFDA